MPREVVLQKIGQIFIKDYFLALREISVRYTPEEAFGYPDEEKKLCVLLYGPYKPGDEHRLEKEKYHAHFDIEKMDEAKDLYERLEKGLSS